MATYIMLGKYSPDALGRISADRTWEALAQIKENGGEPKATWVTLGGTDVVAVMDLPDTEHALRTSIGLSKLLGISFTTLPAVTAEEFDKLMA